MSDLTNQGERDRKAQLDLQAADARQVRTDRQTEADRQAQIDHQVKDSPDAAKAALDRRVAAADAAQSTLVGQLAANSDVGQSVGILLKGIAAQVTAAGNDPATLADVTARLNANVDVYTDAVVEHTSTANAEANVIRGIAAEIRACGGDPVKTAALLAKLDAMVVRLDA